MNLIQSFIKNPVKVSVGVLLVILFGVIALLDMPMQLTPEVQVPAITIETRWPGASPSEIEREIVQEQEEQLKGVEGVTKMSGECTDSEGKITLEFAVGTDMSEALLIVNSRLQQVPEYPIDAQQPVITKSSGGNSWIAWFILSPELPDKKLIEEAKAKHPETAATLDRVLQSNNSGLMRTRLKEAVTKYPQLSEILPPERDVSTMLRFAEDNIESRFERVPGVSNSNVRGGREDEVHVVVDPAKLAQRGLTNNDIRNAINARNKDTAGGDYWEGKRRYVVRTLGQFESKDELEDLILVHEENTLIRLKDVANVEWGSSKGGVRVRYFGESAIAINCERESGANVLAVMEGLRAAVKELNEGVLKREGLRLDQVYDETDYIYASIDLVRQNIIVAAVLTVLVLLIFLRSGRSTLVVSLAIPTSLIGTFLVLASLGRTLNVISLAGLAFAVGMLVDNAVVVLENIYRHYQKGEPPFKAAVKGAQEVYGAIVASTATTLAVFLPIIFIEEEAGQLFRDIALAISAAVALSILVSVIVIPTAAARVLSESGMGESSSLLASKESRAKMGWFSRILAVILFPIDLVAKYFVGGVVKTNGIVQKNWMLQAAIVAGFIGSAIFGSFMLLPSIEYLPEGNRNLVFAVIIPPPGYNLDELTAIGKHLEKEMRPYWDADPDDPDVIAAGTPVISGFFYVATGSSVFMGVRCADDERGGELVGPMNRALGTIPGTFGFAQQSSLFGQGLSGGRSIELEISGPDLTKLIFTGYAVKGQAEALLPGANVRPLSSIDLSKPEVHVVPKWEVASELGLSARDIGYDVDALVDGAYAGDYFKNGKKIDIRIMGNPDALKFGQDMRDLPIATRTGELVPLSTVATVTDSTGPEKIDRRERERVVVMSVTPPADIALSDAIQTIETQMVKPMRDSGALDGGYNIKLAGTADKLAATWTALKWNFLLALLITFLLLAGLFESWVYPLVIIMSVPLAAVGGLLGLQMLNVYLGVMGLGGQPLDVLTMLGFIILIGTSVNNAILIVHQALNHMREDGMKPADAIVESVRNRIRPIFMTTSTTVLGLLPLVLSPGAGSELYRGLGSIVLGGLLLSTLITLIVVPSMFGLMVSITTSLKRIFGMGQGKRAQDLV